MFHFRHAFSARLLCCGLFFLFVQSAHSQKYSLTAYADSSITEGTNGFYESLPADYANSEKQYPLLIVLPGMGQLGNGNSDLPEVVSVGIGQRLKEKTLPDVFVTRDKVSYSFIVIIPQLIGETDGEKVVNAVIDSCLKKYRVMKNRVYLSGTSMGGGILWNTVGHSRATAARIAAVVPMAAHNLFDADLATNMVAEHLPIWAFHNNGDQVVLVYRTNFWISGINDIGASPRALKTIFDSGEHDCWTQATDTAYQENGMNIYEWMLSYSREMNVLPVTLAHFDATKNATGNLVTLKWETTFEENNDQFVIERSSDGSNFTHLAGLRAGNDPDGAMYSIVDRQPLTGLNYYRLVQFDVNGKSTDLGTRTININAGAITKLSLYPNPVHNELSFSWQSATTGRSNIRIVNAAGAAIYAVALDKPAGELQGSLPVSTLLPGYYFVEISGGKDVSRQPFLKK